MNTNYTYVIGLMSGTSLDGLDIVYVKFNTQHYASFSIIHATTVSYSEEWRNGLAAAMHYSKDKLNQLNIDYGNYLATQVANFIDEFSIDHVDFIASHGHTVFHQPEKGITLQIGDGTTIANTISLPVICDFRTQDVTLGGQGAPLVPIGDRHLFSSYEYCLNLGGFANVSFEEAGKRIAFDICPVNIVMNHYTRKLGVDFDDRGTMAASGTINHELLAALNQLDFYKKASPKSLGLEWVQQHIFPLINTYEENTSIILRTFVEHVAIQISNSIQENTSVLVTGGGTFNDFLIERINFFRKKGVVIPSKQLINYKEALIFAFLGLLKSRNKVNCLQSVTGAMRDHSSGVLFYPQN